MALLAIFCTNAINIYAGVNGLEAGQALVIALAALAHNAIEVGAGSSASAGHALSATLLMPLAAVTLALLRYNWYVLALHAVAPPRPLRARHRLTPRLPPPQVPGAGVRGRHLLLLFRHGLRRGGHPGPLLEDFASPASPAAGQLCVRGEEPLLLVLLLLLLLRCRAAARHHDCAAPRVLHYYCAITTLLLLLVTS